MTGRQDASSCVSQPIALMALRAIEVTIQGQDHSGTEPDSPGERSRSALSVAEFRKVVESDDPARRRAVCVFGLPGRVRDLAE